ncbi:hypothetical protein ACJMK2_019675 [Sinanodonta woodiana]|uniref:Uncharacterized protein n=1 Tax=Sinanodonta woodiana TaxID=1069815 RepID=A0ABD3TWZ5_SINWO
MRAKKDILLPTHVKMVSEGKLRIYQRKQTIKFQGRLMALWKSYAKKQISTGQLLKQYEIIHGPC